MSSIYITSRFHTSIYGHLSTPRMTFSMLTPKAHLDLVIHPGVGWVCIHPKPTYPRFLSSAPRNHGLFCWDESRYLDHFTCGKKGGPILYSILCSIMFYHILSSPGWVYIPEFFAGFAPKFLVLRSSKRTDTYGGLSQHRCIGVFGIELLRRSSNHRGKSIYV